MSNLRILEGGRAAYAFSCAKEGISISEYESWAKKMPMLIKTNGLGAALAFLKSKDKRVYQKLYDQAKAWLIHDDCPLKNLLGLSESAELIEKVISLESPAYRAATIELITFFNWVRRFASGLDNSSSNELD
jgi:CRISPR-associated protein Cmr5